MKEFKKYIIGFLIGLLGVGAVSYAADSGSIGALFKVSGGSWVLMGDNIEDGTIDSSEIEDGAIVNTKLGNLSVSTIKIAEGAISNTKMAANSVTTSSIKDLNVTTDKIADGAITSDKIAAGVIDSIDDSNYLKNNVDGTLTGNLNVTGNIKTPGHIYGNNIYSYDALNEIGGFVSSSTANDGSISLNATGVNGAPTGNFLSIERNDGLNLYLNGSKKMSVDTSGNIDVSGNIYANNIKGGFCNIKDRDRDYNLLNGDDICYVGNKKYNFRASTNTQNTIQPGAGNGLITGSLNHPYLTIGNKKGYLNYDNISANEYCKGLGFESGVATQGFYNSSIDLMYFENGEWKHKKGGSYSFRTNCSNRILELNPIPSENDLEKIILLGETVSNTAGIIDNISKTKSVSYKVIGDGSSTSTYNCAEITLPKECMSEFGDDLGPACKISHTLWYNNRDTNPGVGAYRYQGGGYQRYFRVIPLGLDSNHYTGKKWLMGGYTSNGNAWYTYTTTQTNSDNRSTGMSNYGGIVGYDKWVSCDDETSTSNSNNSKNPLVVKLVVRNDFTGVFKIDYPSSQDDNYYEKIFR